jgi:hypothetical protein
MNNIYEESKVFISYQTTDKNIAGEIKRILEAYNINSFLAYEDLEVSVEWENEILKRINESTLFICLLSKNYSNSIYCLQESGIAIIKNMTIIPLSIDDAISPGFLSKYQSKKIDPKKILVDDIIPGLIKWNKDLAIKIIIDIIGASGSFRGAEENFRTYFHYLNDLSDKQAIDLFEKILDNSQIYCAHLCIKEYIPKLIQKYKYVLTQGEYRKFKKSCGVYGISI